MAAGIQCVVHRLPDTSDEREIEEVIRELSADARVHAILVQVRRWFCSLRPTPPHVVLSLSLTHTQHCPVAVVQLPLPDHVDMHYILDCVAPSKDVDGLTTTNTGLLQQRRHPPFASCTALVRRFCLPNGCLSVLFCSACQSVCLFVSLRVSLPGACLLGCLGGLLAGCRQVWDACESHMNVRPHARCCVLLVGMHGAAPRSGHRSSRGQRGCDWSQCPGW